MKKENVLAEIENYLRNELLEAQTPERAQELQRLIDQYRFLPRRLYGPSDLIIPSALVELDLNGTRAWYFIAPAGGGLVTRVDGEPVQVITPQSPLGEALMGKRAGERVSVGIRGGSREYHVISVC